jgi:hypothetical protein
VPVKNINLDALAKFDALQLWLQIDEATKHDPHGFRLTKGEQAQLAIRNGEHEKLLPAQAECMDIMAKDNVHFRDVTVSAFKEAHSELRSYSVDQISKALNRLGIEQQIKYKTVDGKRTSARVRRLPMWKPNNQFHYHTQNPFTDE